MTTSISKFRKANRGFISELGSFANVCKQLFAMKEVQITVKVGGKDTIVTMAQHLESMGVTMPKNKKGMVAAIGAAWDVSLINEDHSMALYLDTKQTDEEDKVQYTRTITDKGEVKFVAISQMERQSPEKWSMGLVLEGLAQSAAIEDAIAERLESANKCAKLLEGDVYRADMVQLPEGGRKLTYKLAKAATEAVPVAKTTKAAVKKANAAKATKKAAAKKAAAKKAA